MFKTPLPEKLQLGAANFLYPVLERLNSLIDCVDELRKEREEVPLPIGSETEYGFINNPYSPVTTIEEIKKKARQDWLREEIVRLGRMKTADYPSSLADPVGFIKCLSNNNTLQTLIDRYQEELDQDKQ